MGRRPAHHARPRLPSRSRAGRPKRSAGCSPRGIFASHGNFYAMTVVERLGLGEAGLVRLGCACYTTDEEVARVIEGVRSR